MVTVLLSSLCLLWMQEPQAPPVRFELEVQRIQADVALEPSGVVFAGETLLLQLHIAMEQEFFEKNLLAQWRAPLDFQAELSTPWSEPNAAFLLLPTANQNSISLVVDREEGAIEKMEDSGNGRIRFRLQQKIQAQGEVLSLPPASLKLAWATAFEEDMIRGQVPLDRQMETLWTKEFRTNVQPIPTLGQPQDYHGAVGDFTMHLAELENEGARKLEIVFRGRGHLTAEQLPRMEQLSNFPLSAQRTEILDDGIKLHLETLSVAPVPALSWSFFNPESSFFITRSIGVLAPTETGVKSRGDKWTLWIWLAGFATLLLGVFFWPRSPAKAPQETKRKVGAVKPRLVEPKDLLDDLAGLLQCSRDEVYADNLLSKLKQAGVEDSLADACATAIHAVFQSRYAGRGTSPSDEELDALRKRLQASR